MASYGGEDNRTEPDNYESLMQGYRQWLGGLPADVARKVAWENGAALFGLP